MLKQVILKQINKYFIFYDVPKLRTTLEHTFDAQNAIDVCPEQE